MRDVNFTEVGMKNFGPYIDPMILKFDNNSLTLITGPNGIGKTMALDSIPFTLYGMTSKGARGDDVVNNVVGRNCHTWVKFNIGSDQYVVDRYQKYTRRGNTVTITKNKSKQPYKKGHREVLPEVERLLCPQKSFMNTLMFGQKVKDFFTDLVDSDKKEIFRKILNLERYVAFYKKADEFLKSLKQTLSDLNTKVEVNKQLLLNLVVEIDRIQLAKKTFYTEKDKVIKEMTKSIEDNERLRDQWKKQLDEYSEEDYDLSKLQSEIKELENEETKITENQSVKYRELENKRDLKISELQKSAMQSKQEVQEKWSVKLEEKRDHYNHLKDKYDDEINELIDRKSKTDLEINGHESTIFNLEDNKQQFQQGLQEEYCPTCLQPINEECTKNLNTQIDSLDEEIKRRNREILKLQSVRKKILSEMKRLGDNKLEIQRVWKEDETDNGLFRKQEEKNIDEKLEGVLKQVQALYEQQVEQIKNDDLEALIAVENKKHALIDKLNQQQEVANKISKIKETIESLTRSIIQGTANLRSKEGEEYDDDQLYSYMKKQKDLDIQKDLYQLQLKEVSEEMEIVEFWKSAFSATGIPSMLIDESVPFMNRRVAEYLDKLTNGRYIVAFDTLAETKGGDFRDKISVNVLDTHTRASSRIQLSGGQTRIIDIATILTLGDLQSNIQDVSFNILLFDEIFDSLDEENIGFVSKVLSNMKIGKSIYLISHRHEDQLEADETLVLN